MTKRLPGRSDDTVGVAYALSRFSRSAPGFDIDGIFLTGVRSPRRNSEAVPEAIYQAVTGAGPGVALQPDFQYVFRSSCGIANPRDPNGSRIKNAAVFGLRAAIHY